MNSELRVTHQYEPIIGIWVKAEQRHIETFIKNWETRKDVQAFCVYDLPPMLPEGGIIFLHAIKLNRLIAYAKYVGYEQVKGWYEHTKFRDDRLWIEERERIWQTFGPHRLHTHDKDEFDKFWKAQMGVRGLFLMKDLQRLQKTISWDDSMKILQVFRPLGFSYRYLIESQVRQFLELIGLEMEIQIEGILSPRVILKQR
ncbi:MAG: hypothetical protein QXI65_07175 [Metallosphaera sp.]